MRRVWLALVLLTAACRAPPHEVPPAEPTPVWLPAPDPLPGVRPEDRDVSVWLARWGVRADEPVLSPASQSWLAARAASARPPYSLDVLRVPVAHRTLERAITERTERVQQELAAGSLRRHGGMRADAAWSATLVREVPGVASGPLRVARAPLAVRCVPTLEPLVRASDLGRFEPIDRNACTTLATGEPFELLGAALPGAPLVLARTRSVIGWIDARAVAELPPVAEARGVFLDMLVAERRGRPPLTRGSIARAAFAELGRPYGWGGSRDGIDCSGLVELVFGQHGIELPRHSRAQGRSGTHTIEIPPEATEAERLSLLDRAWDEGVVVLHFPGHVLLYLGRDADGAPRAIHALYEYAELVDGVERVRDVGRVVVSSLELGRGTSRRSFLERLTHLAVFGRTVDDDTAPNLEGLPADEALD